MDAKTKETLTQKGWRVGSTQEYLALTDEEMQFVELRLALGGLLREQRKEHGYTQALLAKKLHSSQSRIAKMESGDNSVTIDLILRSLLHLGVSNKKISEYMAKV